MSVVMNMSDFAIEEAPTPSAYEATSQTSMGLPLQLDILCNEAAWARQHKRMPGSMVNIDVELFLESMTTYRG